MKVSTILTLAIHAANVLAAPIAAPEADLAKDSIIIKSAGTYKRDAPVLDKDSIIIKSAGTYKRDAPALEKDSIIIKSAGTYKRNSASLEKDSIIIKSAGTYKRGEDEKREPTDVRSTKLFDLFQVLTKSSAFQKLHYHQVCRHILKALKVDQCICPVSMIDRHSSHVESCKYFGT